MINKIYVFGLGAIGSNVLLTLIKKYGDTIKFFGVDFDKVEERNIQTQAYLLSHLKIKKAMAMNGVIGLNVRKFQYIPIIEKITSVESLKKHSTLFDDSTLFIDCFDNSESRQILKDSKNIYKLKNVLHLGFSPEYSAEFIWDEQYSVPNNISADKNDICQMSDAIPWINYMCGFFVNMIVEFINYNNRNSYIIVNKYNIRKL